MKKISSFGFAALLLALTVVQTSCLGAFAAGEPAKFPHPFESGIINANRFQAAKVIEAPKPEITAEMAGDKVTVSCLARFRISEDGKVQVSLLTSSGSDDLDEVVLATLKKWKFRPATLNGKAIVSTRRLLVEFEVK